MLEDGAAIYKLAGEASVFSFGLQKIEGSTGQKVFAAQIEKVSGVFASLIRLISIKSHCSPSICTSICNRWNKRVVIRRIQTKTDSFK